MKKIILISIVFFCCACQYVDKKKEHVESKQIVRAEYANLFNVDSAFHYLEKQVQFGTRVPNTKPHVECGDYLVAKLKQFGAKVYEQKMSLTAYNGAKLACRNIIASYHPEKKQRILLFAHWDTRPYADHDLDKKNYKTPIPGANDGASGVAVLLEMARLFQQKAPSKGVDIIFFDAEDYGTPEFLGESEVEDDWCLGSQYWTKHPHVPNYKAEFGILLDMVGGYDPVFYKESVSIYFAPQIVDKVWKKAIDLGYGAYFKHAKGGMLTDDHLYVNKNMKIPSIDIIDFDPRREKGFPDTWHTLEDNCENISKETLKMVGRVVTEVVYSEN